MALTQSTRPLALFTPFGEDVLLLSRVFGREELSSPFDYELEAFSERDDLNPVDIIGRNVSWRVDRSGDDIRWFNGYVSNFQNRGRNDRFSVYELTVVPWLWFLSQTTDSRIFQHHTTPEIVERIFSDLGFTDFVWKLRETYEQREYCVQYRESDLNFVSRLLEEDGIFYYFRQENGSHRLILSDTPSGYDDLADNMVDFPSPGQEAGIVDQIKQWHRSCSFRPGKIALRDYNFETPRTNLEVGDTTVNEIGNNGSFELYDYPARYDNAGLGNRFARVRMEEQEAQHDVVSGESTYRSFAPGGRFKVKNHRLRSELDKYYAITSVTTQASLKENYTTSTNGSSGNGQLEFKNRFECIPAEMPFRPQRKAAKAIVKGPQTAVVVGPPGEEIYTDQHGRVKVQFHWDREGSFDDQSSCWVRVSQSHAGQKWGSIDLPRIGEEVVVNFLEGDPDRPMIKGRIYNAAKMPPFGLPGAMTRSGMKSDTHKGSGYNEMTTDDTASQEQLRVNAQKDMDTTVGNDQTLAVGVDRAESIGNDDTTKIGVDASTEIGNDQATTVGTNMDVDVGNNLVITAGTSITLKTGPSTIHMNQAGVITISSTIVTSAAAVTNSILAPMTQIAGSSVLNEVGAINLKIGGITKVNASSEATVTGATTSTRGGQVVIKGLPIMIGEVGAPLAQLPSTPEVVGNEAPAGPEGPALASSEGEGADDLGQGKANAPADFQKVPAGKSEGDDGAQNDAEANVADDGDQPAELEPEYSIEEEQPELDDVAADNRVKDLQSDYMNAKDPEERKRIRDQLIAQDIAKGMNPAEARKRQELLDELLEYPPHNPYQEKPRELKLDDTQFWEKAKPGVYRDGELVYAVLPGDAKMEPIVRTGDEYFHATAGRAANDSNVVVNGNAYGLTKAGYIDVVIGNDPVDPGRVIPEGQVYQGGTQVTGTSEPNRFYMATVPKDGKLKYDFGFGDPPPNSQSAVGGAGPIIINGLPYGEQNKYSTGVPAGAPKTGDPGTTYSPYLEQRSNLTYSNFQERPATTGQTVVAHSSSQNALLVISQPDRGTPGGATTGTDLNGVRDKLVSNGEIDNAVFLDGSDSSLFIAGGNQYSQQGNKKDQTTNVGVVFSNP